MADQTQDTGFLTARIDLQGLEQDLNTFKEKLDGWSDAIVRKTEAEKVQHVREMQKLSGIGYRVPLQSFISKLNSI